MTDTVSPEEFSGAQTTHVLEPRKRVFMPRTFGERALSFWWYVARQLFFRWSPPPFNAWRCMWLRLFGVKISGKVYVSASVRIDFPWNLELGDCVFIAHKCIINCMGKVKIGSKTHISQYSHICSGTHEYGEVDMRIKSCPITIGEDVWIAADAFVGPGVTIGDGAVLAARSSAFGNLPAGQVCIGEPAKPYKKRDDGDRA